jgi:hypothetical protein
LGQRILKRDLSAAEIAPLVADLDAATRTRGEVAADLYGLAEAGQVRAKVWVQKLLSRNPSESELSTYGSFVLNTSDVAAIGLIAGSAGYFDLAQTRFTQATLTATATTVIVSGAQVVSASYATDGTGNGTVVLAAGVTPPAAGGFLVVNNTVRPVTGRDRPGHRGDRRVRAERPP